MILTKSQQKLYRSILFKHQDGIAFVAIVCVLAKKRVFEFISQDKTFTLDELQNQFPFFHKGYLNIALRGLASQGYFTYTIVEGTVALKVKQKFYSLLDSIEIYKQFNELYTVQSELLKAPVTAPISFPPELLHYAQTLKKLKSKILSINEEVFWHIEALIVLPCLVKIGYNSSILNSSKEAIIYDAPVLHQVFTELGLISEGRLTERGQFLVQKSYAYGVTVSYWPLFLNTEAYLYGSFAPFFEKNELGIEQHVYRGINVWGSGGAHATYFKKFDEVILDIFNQPIEEQPKGIIDVGCGNGALLEHVFNLIWSSSLRRSDLDKNKLILVGADFNKEALLSTQRNLEKADIWVEVIWGDIGNPEELDKKLKEKYEVALSELLNIRSFLDHNRPFNPPKEIINFVSNATGAFAYRGNYLTNEEVEQSLTEHFNKWKPYIKKYGLLLIELHTVHPEIVSENIGRTPCTAYDITHGFSDQYIVELVSFYSSVLRAGLEVDSKHRYVFPNEKTPTISISLIKEKSS